MNLKVVFLALAVATVALSSIVLFQYLNTLNAQNELNASQPETLEITESEIWNTQAGLILVNYGKTDAIITRITARGVDCNWNKVYAWKGEIGSVSSLTAPQGNLSGGTFKTVVDGAERTFAQAPNGMRINAYQMAVLYLDGINLTLQDLPSKVTIAVFTERNVYTTETTANAPAIAFMGTEEIRITNVSFSDAQISITARNTGSSPVTINELLISNNKQNFEAQTIQPNESIEATVGYHWVSGTSYQFKLVSSKGNVFVYSATAPAA